METKESKTYYESLAKEKDIWHADKRSNYYYKEHIRYDCVIKSLPGRVNSALDLGCGDGYLSYLIAKKGIPVTSIDLSANRLEKFKTQADQLKIRQIEGDITNVDLPSESYDLVVSSEVIEHIRDYQMVLKEAYRLLKKEGCFIVTVPNNQTLRPFTCPHCLNKIYPDDHVNSYTAESLSADLEKVGFQVDKVMVLRSKILNQLQFHLKLKYGVIVKLMDWILSRLFKKYTYYLLIRSKKN